MPLIIVADTPQEVLGKVADWLVEYAETIATSAELSRDARGVETRAATMQLLALMLRAGSVVPNVAFNPATPLHVEPPPKATWSRNRRLPVMVGKPNGSGS